MSSDMRGRLRAVLLLFVSLFFVLAVALAYGTSSASAAVLFEDGSGDLLDRIQDALSLAWQLLQLLGITGGN